MKFENTKKAFIRNGKHDKSKNPLNIPISRLLAVTSQLTKNNYSKIYLDETNNLVFKRL